MSDQERALSNLPNMSLSARIFCILATDETLLSLTKLQYNLEGAAWPRIVSQIRYYFRCKQGVNTYRAQLGNAGKRLWFREPFFCRKHLSARPKKGLSRQGRGKILRCIPKDNKMISRIRYLTKMTKKRTILPVGLEVQFLDGVLRVTVFLLPPRLGEVESRALVPVVGNWGLNKARG